MIKKGFVIGIILLFFGTSLVSGLNNNKYENNIESENIPEHSENRGILFQDDFNDNTKDLDKWTEVYNQGIWYEQNQRTEFYLTSGEPTKEGIESIEIPITLSTSDSINISVDMISNIGSNTDYGQQTVIISDGADWLFFEYYRGGSRFRCQDRYNSIIDLGPHGDGSWSNHVEIYQGKYRVKMDTYDSGWKNSPLLFSTTSYFTIKMYINFNIPPGSWWQAGFDNIIVESENQPPIANFSYYPTNPTKNDIVQFTDTSTAPNSTIVSLWWDFGDGYYSDLQNPVHCYYEDGIYNVSLTVTNDYGLKDTTAEIVMVYTPNSPPEVPDIDGPPSGTAGFEYNFTFVTTDPEGENVYYNISWGDGDEVLWIGPYNSGEVITLGHTWTSQGTYTIKAKAKDIYGAESDWGTLTVTMPRNKAINTQFQNWLQSHPNLFPILRVLLQRLGL